jgi:hypothetical protein
MYYYIIIFLYYYIFILLYYYIRGTLGQESAAMIPHLCTYQTPHKCPFNLILLYSMY